MEKNHMGRVTAVATIENMEDLWKAKSGQIPQDEVRRVVVTDALVDTGATILGLPSRVIKQLGLKKQYDKRVISSTGIGQTGVYEAVRLTIMDRSYPFDPMEVPDETPVLIGQVPLEVFDLVVDLQARQLIPNPAHGGEQTFELF